MGIEQMKDSRFQRFGTFEVDLQSRELRRSGVLIKLQDQPFEILTALLEKPAEIVAREELQKRLWPSGTFVEMDLNLNSAVKKLRQALGDDSDNTRFIETLYRKGYRFIAPVSGSLAFPVAAPNHTTEPLPDTPQEQAKPPVARANRFVYLAILPVLLLAGGVLVFRLTSSDPPRITNYTPVTHDGRAKGFESLVTDGVRLFTRETQGGQFVIAQVAAAGGDTAIIPDPFQGARVDDVTPDGSALLVLATRDTGKEWSVWRVPLPTGSPTRLGSFLAHSAAICRLSGDIVFSNEGDIFAARADGSSPRKLASFDGLAEDLRYSPSCEKIRFTRIKDNSKALWQIGSDGKGLRPLLPKWNGAAQECCGNWTPDGKYFVFQSSRSGRSDIWALPEGSRWFEDRAPIQLTNGPLDFTLPVPSRDGSRIFAIGSLPRAQLVRYEAKAGFVPYAGGLSAEGATFSLDGQWMAYVSVPDGALWRSKSDGNERIQLTQAPLRAGLPKWSPDGQQIAFMGHTNDSGWHAYLVSAKGGQSQELVPGSEAGFDPEWSPDGKTIFVSLKIPFKQSGGISTVDLKTRATAEIPGSSNFFSPHCSPDGKFLSAITTDSRKLMVLDRSTGQWTTLVNMPETLITLPNWSHDGKYVYFEALSPQDSALFRVRFSDRELERVLSLNGIRRFYGEIWRLSSLAPDDSFLLSLDVGDQEIYALDWQKQ